MPLRVHCPSCQTLLDIADEHAGKSICCPKCREPVQVAALAESAQPIPDNSPPRKSAPVGLIIAAIVGGVLFLCCGAASLIGYLVVYPAYRAAADAAAKAQADQKAKTKPQADDGPVVWQPGNAERWQGLQQVLSQNPGVQLLQWESARWDRTQAYNDTKAMLVAHPDIDGVWTANDDMAMGAIQALKEAGLAGKVLVTGCDGIREMFDAVKEGLGAATIVNDGKYQAELGLAMALAAKQGKLDVASLPHKYRQFEIPAVNVNRENVDQVLHDYVENTPAYDLTNFFAKWSKAIP